MSLTPERVIIERVSRAKDGKGGKTEAWTAISGTWFATRNFYRKESVEVIDQSARASEGPGVQEKQKQFFTFEGPRFPTVRREYKITGSDGVARRVLDVRPYEETLQVDTEAYS